MPPAPAQSAAAAYVPWTQHPTLPGKLSDPLPVGSWLFIPKRRAAANADTSTTSLPAGFYTPETLATYLGGSTSTIDRMVSYFARHEVDKQGSSWETYGTGRQAWDGWGGDPGRRWATGLARRMDAATGHAGPDGSQSTETVPSRRACSLRAR